MPSRKPVGLSVVVQDSCARGSCNRNARVYAWPMRRVVVTGLGAVTPLGNDAPSTWRRRRRGPRAASTSSARSTPSGFPVRIAAEVKDFDPSAVVSPKEARRLDRNVLLSRRAPAGRRVADAGLDGVYDPTRVGILFGIRDRRLPRDHRAGRGAARARAGPRLAVLHPERARRRGERAARDLARFPRPELRAGLGVRDRLARGRRGGGADPARRRRRRARRRRRGVHAPADPRRLLRDARARRRGRVSAARLAPVRRDARRVRDGRGRLRARARGARGGASARRDDLRRGARLRRLERRAPPGAARSGGGRRRGDDARRARAGRRRAASRSATSTRTGRRRRSATRPRRGRSRRSSATTRTSSPSPRRSR